MDWFRSLAPRERQFVSLGAFFVLLSIIYLFIYEPLETALEEDKTRLALRQAEWSQLVTITDEYKRLGGGEQAKIARDKRSLLAIIDQGGSAAGIKSSIKRLTPEGVNKVRVRVEDVVFDKLLQWLVTNSTKHAINAELFLVRKTDQAGRVNATLLFASK